MLQDFQSVFIILGSYALNSQYEIGNSMLARL